MFERLRQQGFEILTLHHCEAILRHDMPQAVTDIESTLLDLRISVETLVRGGGGENILTQWMRRRLSDDLGWKKHNFEIKKIVDGVERESVTHEIDHVKRYEAGVFALEIEWNNKDPFYDRDLENFKRLHAEGVISVGGIITRGSRLQDNLRPIIARFARDRGLSSSESLLEFYSPTIRQKEIILSAAERFGSFEDGWAHSFVSDKFGEASTHWRKLEDRVNRGVGSPCPLLLIGIPDSVLVS